MKTEDFNARTRSVHFFKSNQWYNIDNINVANRLFFNILQNCKIYAIFSSSKCIYIFFFFIFRIRNNNNCEFF